jgi:hypothetical protein
MGFLDFLTQSQPKKSKIPPLGSGRRLSSKLPLSKSLKTFESILAGYGAPKYEHLPHYFQAGWVWHSEEHEAPHSVLAASDQNDQMFFTAFWKTDDGTEIGIFPLGGGDDRLSDLPIIGHWKQKDKSLQSIGVIPHGQLSLAVPKLPDNFLEDILRIAGYPATPHNLAVINEMMCKSILLKAYEYMTKLAPGEVNRFMQTHQVAGRSIEEYSRQVLQELVEWNPQVLPYMQIMLIRNKAAILSTASKKGTFWNNLEKK